MLFAQSCKNVRHILDDLMASVWNFFFIFVSMNSSWTKIELSIKSFLSTTAYQTVLVCTSFQVEKAAILSSGNPFHLLYKSQISINRSMKIKLILKSCFNFDCLEKSRSGKNRFMPSIHICQVLVQPLCNNYVLNVALTVSFKNCKQITKRT